MRDAAHCDLVCTYIYSAIVVVDQRYMLGSIHFFQRIQNPNNVQIWVGGWVIATWMFGFQNPLVVKLGFESIRCILDK